MWRHEEIWPRKISQVKRENAGVIESYKKDQTFMKSTRSRSRLGAGDFNPGHYRAGPIHHLGWPMGEAGSDLEQAGIRPDEVAYRGSNEILLAPRRTAMHVPVAIIDPHSGWYGEFRFTRCDLCGRLNISGRVDTWSAVPSFGHSRYCSVAMTTADWIPPNIRERSQS